MKTRENELMTIYLAVDLTLLNMAILSTAYLNSEHTQNAFQHIYIYILHGNLSWIITYFAFSKKNLYLRDGFSNRFLRITKRMLAYLILSSMVAFFLLPSWFSREFFLTYAFVLYLFKLLGYWAFYEFLRCRRKNGLNTNRVLIVGNNETSRFLRQIIEVNTILGYRFVGFLSSSSPNAKDALGSREDIERVIEEHKIQTVFLTPSIYNEPMKMTEYLRICNKAGVRLRIVPQNQRWFRKRVNMESVGELVVINPQEIPLDNAGARLYKRLFDIFFSLFIILFVFSWLFPVLAIAIKLSSKGPVFFKQKRTGLNNKEFNCLKFRSMAPNKNADKLQAMVNDSRITRLGRFLRSSNLDELPQFFNVLFGQMSVVGPRPHMLSHTEEYSQLIEFYLTRHYVKPGVTGWAQVNGLRGNTDELWKMEKRVECDKEYIENWTFWWDLKIIWLTVFGKKVHENAG